jgi:hypothetical protein
MVAEKRGVAPSVLVRHWILDEIEKAAAELRI